MTARTKRRIGRCMVALPFVAMFIGAGIEIGWGPTAGIFGGCAALLVYLYFAIHLSSAEEE